VVIPILAGTIGEDLTGLVVIKVAEYIGVASQNKRKGAVVRRHGGRIRIQIRRTQDIAWSVQGLIGTAQSNADEVKVVLKGADLTYQLDVCPKIQRVIAFSPRKTFTKFRHRNISRLGCRTEVWIGKRSTKCKEVGISRIHKRRKAKYGAHEACRRLVDDGARGTPRPTNRKRVAVELITTVRRSIPRELLDGSVEVVVFCVAVNASSKKESVFFGKAVVNTCRIQVFGFVGRRV